MTIKQKFNEYIASGDISISDEQRDWILPFIEKCVGEERESVVNKLMDYADANIADEKLNRIWFKTTVEVALTQEDKIK